jgi:outer membrane protein OmpA-like peptidoglycan-associated protein
MRHPITILALTLIACGGATPPAENADTAASDSTSPAETSSSSDSASSDAPAEKPSEKSADDFTALDTHTAKDTQGEKPSDLKPTKTEALMKFVVVDKNKGPIPGIVVSMTGADGKTYYTQESDATGYAEVLVPVAQKYDIVYVSLGRKDITAAYTVTDEAKQTIKLTLRYERKERKVEEQERFVLDGITFETAKAVIKEESYPRLDRVVEYMTHKPKARIEIAGHTDNVGNKATNQKLSENRAKACRDYIVSKGIAADRIEVIGWGDEKPIASNDTESGRQRNRRIEATEL